MSWKKDFAPDLSLERACLAEMVRATFQRKGMRTRVNETERPRSLGSVPPSFPNH